MKINGCDLLVLQASDKNTKMINCLDKKNKQHIIGKLLCNGIQDRYWYSKIDAIAINLFGYVAGQGLRNTFYPNL